ncbi:hypothetical protein Meth11DRAFT_1567 [Methylophilaceae bacterium 11]|nr:hypothetical protein Meth11DRAFT_1567 [Methylophilaceae bacterium 11]
MKIDSLRLLILCWFTLGVFTLIGHVGWKDWPPEAIAYAQWVEYKIDPNPLPFQYQAYFPSLIISISAMTLLFFRNTYGKFVLLIGLVLHFYSEQSSIPTIASNAELTLNSIFYLLTGVILGISFTNWLTHHSSGTG